MYRDLGYLNDKTDNNILIIFSVQLNSIETLTSSRNCVTQLMHFDRIYKYLKKTHIKTVTVQVINLNLKLYE